MPPADAQVDDDDRVLKEHPPIPRLPLPRTVLFPSAGGAIDLPALKLHLIREGRLAKTDAIDLIRATRAVLAKEPNLLKLRDPIAVCGDLHGQFFDLVKLLEVAGDPAKTQYLFLGDYVDRGCFSTEVLFYLFSLKITYPKTLFLLRGNHECRHLTAFFNFKEECIYKYDLEIYEEFMKCFDALPLSACLNEKFLCMHGGLSPDVEKVDDINDIDRFKEIPREGAMCDLLWSDPFDEKKDEEEEEGTGHSHGGAEPILWFSFNQTRQCSFVFGVNAVTQFLDNNNLVAVIRAHEAQFDGYRMHMKNEDGVPRVITIFSAPNYCDVYGNKGACLVLDNEVLNIKQFTSSEHPYYLPNFMDIFSWSLPFVAEKVADIMVNVLAMEEEYNETEDGAQPLRANSPTREKKNRVLKDKVMAVTKMMRMYKILRQENELILQLKQLSPNQKIPAGLLREGPEAIKKAISSFKTVQASDKQNEGRPLTEEEQKASDLQKVGSSGFRTTGMTLTRQGSQKSV
eukprot:TRINITY_DN6251_c0_g1_i2.p2 TRINITY_DN6251_c0_g1~~TRINITY_DN6251_c0_g1_i2.p2  ORF type:complete len:533 (-),score=131.04 TRINITY_DN6251_c0_g1_i2:2123-3664(-)